MLPNFARNIFYNLHKSEGFPRVIANFMSWSFMAGVKISGTKPPMDLTPLTLISHRYKFVYIGIPKVATRSFKTHFQDIHREKYGTEIRETKTGFKKALEEYPDYFRFSFVRNPWARTLSCYNSKIGHEDLSLLKRARILSFYKDLEPGMSFRAFAEWLNGEEGRDECADRHWMSQHRFLYRDDGAELCRFVGRYENLQADLDKVMEMIGAPKAELSREGWVSDAQAYRDHYDGTAQNLIARRYARDIELFGYEF